jgi:hypothetical protein
MEKKLESKVSVYVNNFKSSIKEWIDDNEKIDTKTKGELLEFIYDFDNLKFTKDDFTKRKRIKTHVPQWTRCKAKRANGEQCTRKRREGNCYCGTHDKNRPHGVICEEIVDEVKKVVVTLQDINGILYYIDDVENVYVTEDVLNNKIDPGIYAKYQVIDGVYKIVN